MALNKVAVEELAIPDLANDASEREDANFEQNVLGELSLTEEVVHIVLFVMLTSLETRSTLPSVST